MTTLVRIFRYFLSPYFLGLPLALSIEIGARRIIQGQGDVNPLAEIGEDPPGYLVAIAILLILQLALGTSVVTFLDYFKAGRRGYMIAGVVSAILWIVYIKWRGLGSSPTEVLPAEYVMAGLLVAGFNLAFTLRRFQTGWKQSEQFAAPDHH